jgi:hypothetical protein
MTTQAAGLQQFEFPTVTKSSVLSLLDRIPASREMVILSAIMALVQILDGILTGIGIAHFGIAAEGNLLIRTLMQIFGYVPALVFVKSLAVGLVTALCVISTRVSWIAPALRITIAMYVSAAIVPWVTILVTHLA